MTFVCMFILLESAPTHFHKIPHGDSNTLV
jgi:hypothetical protein